MAVPVLGDYQLQFGDTGVLMNGDNDGITPFVDIQQVAGLDSATYRTSSKDTEGQDGATIEAEFESKRVIVISGVVYGQTYDQMESYVDSLKACFAPSKVYQPFYYKAPGVAQRMAYAKCTSGFRSTWDSMRRLAMASFSVTLECGDPIIYGSDEYMWPGSISTANIPGFSFNFGFSFDFGEVEPGVTGSFDAYHYGNRPAPFIATFTGIGVTNPGLLHEGLNRAVVMDVDLEAGDVLIVDFGKRKVTFNGSTRRGSVTREGWFLLQQYVANPLRLLTSSGSLDVVVTTRDAWR